jgi:hypothetical protein
MVDDHDRYLTNQQHLQETTEREQKDMSVMVEVTDKGDTSREEIVIMCFDSQEYHQLCTPPF